MDEHSLRAELERQGFEGPYAVRCGDSIAGLIGRGRRCGIYVLRFADDQYYVGQSVDTSRRFLQHSKVHRDITAISFLPTAQKELDRTERALITQLEAGGIALRNIDGINVPLGARLVDEVVTPDEQSLWRTTGEQPSSVGRRWDEDARRRDRIVEHALADRLFSEQGLPVLRRFVRECLLAPERTERDFWACSCLPGGGDFCSGVFIYSRVNVFQQEVSTVYRLDREEKLRFTFHAQASTLEALTRWRRLVWEFMGVGIEDHRYLSGGPDQLTLACMSPRAASMLLDDPLAARAIREFIWRLMRKGTCLNKDNHVLALADLVLDAPLPRAIIQTYPV